MGTRIRASGRHWVYLMGATAMSGMLSVPALAQEQAPRAQSASSAADSDQDIIVTANRREERGQDVPIAITALSADRLAEQSITKAQDLFASVPSLTVGSAGTGSRESQGFSLRGQGASFQASPAVVVYMAEVPLPGAYSLAQQGGPGQYFDLQNLQVLAGPQGTLFGRNTTGGAVLLVPHRPTNTLGGYIQGGLGNYKNRELEGVINIPLVDDRLIVRAGGQFQDRRGFTKDITFNKYRDDVHYYTGRLTILARMSEGLENQFMVYGTRSRTNGTGQIHLRYNIPGLKGFGFCVDPPTVPSGIAVSCDAYRAGAERSAARGPRATEGSMDSFHNTDTWGLINTTSLELNDSLTLRNIISLQRLKIRYAYDSDATTFQHADVNVSQDILPSGYLNFAPFNLPRDSLRQFTEELQLQGHALDNHLVFTVGGFYYKSRPDGLQAGSQINFCAASLTGSAACQPSQSYYGQTTESKALYGQATLDFGALTPALESLKLTGGYRYTWDNINGFARSYKKTATGFTCSFNNQAVTDPMACTFTGHLPSKAPTWLVGLDYKAMDNALLFAKVSRGYKAGSFNAFSVRPETRTSKPEYVTSYEVGLKSDWQLGTVPLRFNVSAYEVHYKDIQRNVGDFNTATRASGVQLTQARAKIRGIELEGNIRPFEGFELGGNYSYTDAKYTHYTFVPTAATLDCSGATIAPGGTADQSCIPFQYVAPHIFSVHGSYEQALPGEMGSVKLFVSYSHSSRLYGEAVLRPEAQPDAYQEAFGLLNASLTWADVAGAPLDLTAYVTNATNELYRISNTHVYPSQLYSTGTYAEPRMFGLRAKYRFGGE